MSIKLKNNGNRAYAYWIIIGIIISSIIFAVFLLLDVYLINKENPMITIVDALGYFGSSMGAVFGIIGIVLTIQYTQNSIEDQRKEYLQEKIVDDVLSICPLIQIRSKKALSGKYGVIDVCEKGSIEDESSMQHFFFEVSNKGKGVAQNVRINAELVTDKQDYLYLIDSELIDYPEFRSYLNLDETMELSFTIYYNHQNKSDRALHVQIRIEYIDIFLNTYVEIYDLHFYVKVQTITNRGDSRDNPSKFTGRFTHKELISRVVRGRNKEILNIGIAYTKE